jgi:hypothetical protein
MVLPISENLRYSFHSNTISLKPGALPTESLEAPPIPGASHMLGVEEITIC